MGDNDTRQEVMEPAMFTWAGMQTEAANPPDKLYWGQQG